MNDRDQRGQTTNKPAFVRLILLLLIVLAGAFIGQFLGIIFTLPLTGFDMTAIFEMASNPMSSQSNRIPLLILQATGSISMFIIAPWFYLRVVEKTTVDKVMVLSKSVKKPALFALLGIIIIPLALPIGSYIIQWNNGIQFPEALKGIEMSFRSQEDRLAEITQYILNFQTPFEFILAILVVSVIAGISEEFTFRGVMQNIMYDLTNKNKHLAIWITGFIFAAIHFQFYGIVPRMLLGVLFGYLYVWSGRLSVAMIAHMANNAYTVIGAYFYEGNIEEYTVQEAEVVPWPIVILGTILLVATIYFFRKKSLEESENIAELEAE